MKRLVKFSISVVFFAVTTLRNRMRRLFGAMVPGRCVAIYYHVVRPEQVEEFRWQVAEILKWTQPLPANYRGTLAPGHRYSIVTFDDGYANAFENAIPELIKRDIPVTVFIATDALGQCPEWREYKDVGGNDFIIDEESLRNMSSDLLTLGSQTMSHPMLTKINREAAVEEIAGSKKFLENLLDRDVTLLSFPFGDFNESLIRLCRECGYERVFTTLPRFSLLSPDEFNTARVRVDPTDWRLEFRLKLLGAYRWLPKAFSIKRRWASAPAATSVRGEVSGSKAGLERPL